MGPIYVTTMNAPNGLQKKVRNRIDFRQATGGGYTCKSCGYYDKKECKSQLEYAQEQTLNRDLRKSPKELKIDLTGYYLAQGDIEKAKEVAEKMDDYRVIEKL